MYSSELWGPQHKQEIEGHRLQFLTGILPMPRNTPNCYVRLETGSIHVSLEIWRRVLGWWEKNLKMTEDSHPNTLYKRLVVIDKLEQNNANKNWCFQSSMGWDLNEQGSIVYDNWHLRNFFDKIYIFHIM